MYLELALARDFVPSKSEKCRMAQMVSWGSTTRTSCSRRVPKLRKEYAGSQVDEVVEIDVPAPRNLVDLLSKPRRDFAKRCDNGTKWEVMFRRISLSVEATNPSSHFVRVPVCVLNLC
jgi:hypothetical protein